VCKANYGWYQKCTKMNTGVNRCQNRYGCSKCPNGGTSTPGTNGPYRSGSNRPGTLNK
jgi:hypothetical protein